MGEVGVDLKAPVEHLKPLQEQLVAMLKVLSECPHRNKVLVLASLGNDGTDYSAYLLLVMALEMAGIRSDQLIHLHNFYGCPKIVDMWSRQYPNTYFGYSMSAEQFDTQSDSAKGLRSIPLSRILLGTEAPHTWVKISPKRRAVPNDIGRVACKLGSLRDQNWKSVLQSATENAYRLYRDRLPPLES